MKITKYGHACVLVEVAGLNVLFDPGSYNKTPDSEQLDVIVITHDHADHCNTDEIKALQVKFPDVEIITNEGVGKVLAEAGITFTSIADGERMERNGVAIESHGTQHAIIHPDLPMHSQNCGYLIADRFFHPGDSFHVPPKSVEVLALPVGGPWLKIAESAEYAKAVKPKVVVPIHDAMYKPEMIGMTRMIPQNVLAPLGIEFRDLLDDSTQEFED